jgi:hypothetical protein
MGSRDRTVLEVESTRERAGAVSRYDLVLAVIPLAFASAGLADALLALPRPILVAGAAAICILVLIDALFRNPPTAERRDQVDEERGRPDAVDTVGD